MGKEQNEAVLEFLSSYPEEKQKVVLWLRDFIWDCYPQCNELIYDNYNALALGWSLTDRVMHVVCSIALYRTNCNIHFGFYWGNEIADPEKKLIGEGRQYRYILVEGINKFPRAYIKKLMKESYANSLAKVKDKKQLIKGETIVKSISAAKRTATKSLPKKKK